MVAICLKAVVHSGNFIPGSHIAKAFRRSISGKAQPIRLDKLCSPHPTASRAFLSLIISNRSTPKLKTSVSGLMSIAKTAAESSDLQSASPTKSSIAGMEDKLLFLGRRNQHFCVLGMARKSKLPEPQGMEDKLLFLGGATSIYFCVLDMAHKSKLPEPCSSYD
jgi:hypothetical protein